MVSFVTMKCEDGPQESGGDSVAPELDDNSVEMADEGDAEMRLADDTDHSVDQTLSGKQRRQHQARRHVSATNSNTETTGGSQPNAARAGPQVASVVDPDTEDLDEETLKRILACKRLSEGNCNRHLVNLNICRKNSLHMIGESLPPVTEGEPMRHMSHHMSGNIENSQSSSTSSSSLRGGGGAGRHLSSQKRNSQDENTASCSSSTSLDGSGPRSPSRRRSSTVSQCSSVLSEGTRHVLNFDLSPDLPPDSSILEANAISPTDSDRPASPEPSSLGSADGSFDMRPISRMSQFCDDISTDAAASPDSTLGDSNTENQPQAAGSGAGAERMTSSEMMTSERPAGGRHQAQSIDQLGGRETTAKTPESITDNLERIITHVSEVKVSSNAANERLDRRHQRDRQEAAAVAAAVAAGQKRAHTPFGANIQRSKATHIEG